MSKRKTTLGQAPAAPPIPRRAPVAPPAPSPRRDPFRPPAPKKSPKPKLKKALAEYASYAYEVDDRGTVWQHPLVHPYLLDVHSNEEVYEMLLSSGQPAPSWPVAEELLNYARSVWGGETYGLEGLLPDRRRFFEKQAAKLFGDSTAVPDIVAHAEAADPTPKGKYMQWILREWSRREFILPEDIEAVQQTIAVFEDLVRRPAYTGERNILNIRYSEFRKGLLETLRAQTPQTKKERLAIAIAEGSEVVYEKGEFVVVEVTSPEACVYYSKLAIDEVMRQTGLPYEKAAPQTWCTKDPKFAKQYVPTYVMLQNGVVVAQFQPDLGQFMDLYDQRITDPKTLSAIADFFLGA